MAKSTPAQMVAGGVASIVLFAGVAWLSANPSWQSVAEESALVRISFSHGGDRSANCRDRTPEELAALPRNMRQKQVCDRRRPPVTVQLEVDGAPLVNRELAPSGVGGAGPSRIYERVELPAGEHSFAMRLRDNPATTGFDYEAETVTVLKPGQSFVIEFDPDRGGFVFQ